MHAAKTSENVVLAVFEPLFEFDEKGATNAEGLKQYHRLEDIIIEAIVLSEEALNTFNTKSTTTGLKSLLPRYYK